MATRAQVNRLRALAERSAYSDERQELSDAADAIERLTNALEEANRWGQDRICALVNERDNLRAQLDRIAGPKRT